MASFSASTPVSAAVCERAACVPDSERPILMSTMGLPRSAASSATAISFFTFLKPSTKPAMTRVSGSSTSQRAKSVKSRSTSLPVEMMCERPMPASTARSRNGPNAVAPLWHTRPMRPVSPPSVREDAVGQMLSLTFARPRQFGPVKCSPVSFTKAASCRCMSSPVSLPRSANPAEMITAEPAFFAWHSRSTGMTLV